MARPQLTSSIGPEIAAVRTGSSSRFLGPVHFCYALLGMVLYQAHRRCRRVLIENHRRARRSRHGAEKTR